MRRISDIAADFKRSVAAPPHLCCAAQFIAFFAVVGLRRAGYGARTGRGMAQAQLASPAGCPVAFLVAVLVSQGDLRSFPEIATSLAPSRGRISPSVCFDCPFCVISLHVGAQHSHSYDFQWQGPNEPRYRLCPARRQFISIIIRMSTSAQRGRQRLAARCHQA